jgi:hypothetical protein
MPNTSQPKLGGKGGKALIRLFRHVNQGEFWKSSSHSCFDFECLKDKAPVTVNLTIYIDFPFLNLVLLLLIVTSNFLYSSFSQILFWERVLTHDLHEQTKYWGHSCEFPYPAPRNPCINFSSWESPTLGSMIL